MARFLLAALPAAAGLWLAGCADMPSPTLPNQVPATWQGAPGSAPSPGPTLAPDLQSWWKALGDPVLDGLVEQALAQNLTLAQARGRLRQARLLADHDQTLFLPTVNYGARTLQDPSAIDNYFHSGLDASWELGLFGVRTATEQGSQARVDGALAQVQAARVSTVAEVVRQYLLLQAAQQEEATQRRMLELDDQALALHAVRQSTRLGTPAERRVIEARRRQVLAQQGVPRQAANAARQAIAVLLGQTAPDPAWAWARATARPPAEAAALQLQAVPADLLRFRPDVRNAEAEVAKAASELGLARAELYPHLVLGLSYISAYNLTQNRRNVNATLPALGLSLDIPLFDWGRRSKAAEAQAEALNTALLAYRQSVVEAVGETETALAGLALARERVARLDEARAASKELSTQQATRRRLRLGSELERIDTDRAALQAESEWRTAQGDWHQAYVLVYKSLGGAPWEEASEGSAAPNANADTKATSGSTSGATSNPTHDAAPGPRATP